VVAADVVELDSVVVEVVEDGQAELIALAVVGLGNTAAKNEVNKFSTDVRKLVKPFLANKSYYFL
jgi:hypothetical protein